MKRYQAAAIFHARAIKFEPENPKLPYLSAALPLWLPSAGRLDEALSYVQFQLTEIAHPITQITASVLRYRKASVLPGNEQKLLLREQIDHFEKAWAAFQKMAPSLRNDSDLRGLMSLCFELAAFALWKLDENERALNIATEGIAFSPQHAGLYNVRGMVRSRTPEGRADLNQAILFGEPTYSPYYYLAQYALEEERFDEARKYIEDALRRGPGTQIQGQLIGWMAICLSRDGDAKVADIVELFEKAIALAPDIQEIKENHATFLRHVEMASARPISKDFRWKSIGHADFKDLSYFERKFEEKKVRRAHQLV